MPANEQQKRHQILIVENNAVFRKGLEQLLNNEHDIIVYGSADNRIQALSLIEKTNPDLVIADISLKDGSGIELIKVLHRENPHLPILVMSMHEESLYAKLALNAGAMGYINKQEAPENIIKIVHRILQGDRKENFEVTLEIDT